MASSRRLRSAVASLRTLPDDCLTIVFSALYVGELLRASSVCRTWYSIIDTRHTLWAGALFELDPIAVLGPTNFVKLARGGKGCLSLAKALGDSACGRRKRKGAPFFRFGVGKRECRHCAPFDDSPALRLYNRWFFARSEAAGATVICTEDGLRAALANASASVDNTHLGSIIIAEDIDLSAQLEFLTGAVVRIAGVHPRITLTCDSGHVLMAFNVVLEDLVLYSGDEESLYNDDEDGGFDPSIYFPALELCPKLFSAIGGFMILKGVEVFGAQGSGIMNEGGSLSIDQSVASSSSFFSLICKSSPPSDPRVPPFLLSVRGTRFHGDSLWHISANHPTSEADAAALTAVNSFEGDGERVSDGFEAWNGGVLQPWRAECLCRQG